MFFPKAHETSYGRIDSLNEYNNSTHSETQFVPVFAIFASESTYSLSFLDSVDLTRYDAVYDTLP